MKHIFLPRIATALLLVCVLLLGLAGCGKASASDHSGKLPVQSEASSAATPQEAPDAYANRLNLAQLREQALQKNKYATFLAAYLGDADLDADLEGIGIWPSDNATLANYDFFADIDSAHRIDVSDGTTATEVYCVLPANPNQTMFVNIVDEQNNILKEAYRSETGEPILLRCNGDGMPNATVCFSDQYQVEEFWPMTVVTHGQRYLIQPNGGTCYDFTVYSNQPTGESSQVPDGEWQAEISDPNNNFELVTMKLDLWEATGYAELSFFDSRSGDFMVGYSGVFMLQDDEHFLLDLTCNENCTGKSEYDGPIHGTYFYSIVPGSSLTISVANTDGTPFYVNHAYEPISFFPVAQNAIDEAEKERIGTIVTNYYETTSNYRPGCFEVNPYQDSELIVHLYDDMGDHISTCGWYTINPDTLQGNDDMTGETIDFSDFEGGVG